MSFLVDVCWFLSCIFSGCDPIWDREPAFYLLCYINCFANGFLVKPRGFLVQIVCCCVQDHGVETSTFAGCRQKEEGTVARDDVRPFSVAGCTGERPCPGWSLSMRLCNSCIRCN